MKLYGSILIVLAFANISNGQGLPVSSLPTVLFESNGGVHNVVEGSVIQLYCSVPSPTATLTWTKDGTPVVFDVPHLRERTVNDSDTTNSILTMDNFVSSDNGMYQCLAEKSGFNSSGGTLTLNAWRSTDDGVLSITNEPADNELSRELSLAYSDNRTGSALGSTVGSSLLNCEAERSGVSNSTPIVTWIKDGELLSSTTAFSSSLDIASFTAADAGVYQCIFIDTDATAEVITSIPFRLDSDTFGDFNGVPFNTIFLETVSPEVIFLHPPEKLVIEATVRGRYSRIVWHRNGTSVPQSSLSNFNEIYVVQKTSTADFGHYEVIPFTSPPTLQLLRPPMLEFIVTSPATYKCPQMVPTPPPCPTATTPQPTFAPSVPTEPITTEPESTELVFTEPESLFHPTTDHTLVDSIPADLTTDDSMPTEFLSDDVELISESVAPTTDKEVQSEDGLITGDIAAVVLAIILMIVLAIIALSVPIACGYFKKQKLNTGKNKARLEVSQNWQTKEMKDNDAYISTTPNMPLEDNVAYVETTHPIPTEHNVAYCDNTAVQTQKLMQDNVADGTIQTEDSAVYSTIGN